MEISSYSMRHVEEFPTDIAVATRAWTYEMLAGPQSEGPAKRAYEDALRRLSWTVDSQNFAWTHVHPLKGAAN